MYTTIVALSLLVSSTLAAPLKNLPRDVITANTIIADIKGIDKGVNDVRAATANYNGGLISTVALVPGFTEIEVANRKGYADANLRVSKFSASESKAIVQTVIKTVGIDIPASIKELEAKKAVLEASGQAALIPPLLKVLLYDHDTFSAAVSAKLSSDLAAGAAVVAKIHNAIQEGIDYFSE
jgi:hypothetical protein